MHREHLGAQDLQTCSQPVADMLRCAKFSPEMVTLSPPERGTLTCAEYVEISGNADIRFVPV